MSHSNIAGTISDAAHDVMSSAKSTIADTASRVQDKATDLKKSTAKYVRDNNAREMFSDVQGLVKANPGKALVVAVVLGFFAGRMFKND